MKANLQLSHKFAVDSGLTKPKLHFTAGTNPGKMLFYKLSLEHIMLKCKFLNSLLKFAEDAI